MITWFKLLSNWIARIFAWLGEAKKGWGALVAIFGVFIFWFVVLPGWESRIRFTGMSLELLGLSTVALGIRENGKLFNRPGPDEIVRNWFGRFPKFRRDVRIVPGTAHLNLEGKAPVIGVGSASLSATASLEERVAFLEKGLDQANDRIHEIQRKVTEEAQKLGSALDAARHEREFGDEKNSNLIQEAIAGGLYLEATGVLWLFFGILFATASSEIANCFFGVK